MNHEMTDYPHPDGQQEPVKWYREFYVWLVILFPVMSIFMGITTIALSVSSYDGLVVDDYYKRGLAINEVLAREERAENLGLESSLDINPVDSVISVQLAAASPEFSYPEQLQIKFMHATRAGHDQALRLTQMETGMYRGGMDTLAPGYWHVEIAADDWRLLDSYWQHTVGE